jgi:Pro-kumamolisin, activation domain
MPSEVAMTCFDQAGKQIHIALIGVAAAGLAFGQPLRNHVPQAVRESQRLGSAPAQNRMALAIGLPLRNAAELEQFLGQVSDPNSSHYRQYLSADEFAARFGPSQDDYDKLSAFFQANGFDISGTHPNRLILDVTGPVSAIENTFHTHITLWEHATRGEFFAPDSEPWIDAGVPILDVTGMDNFVLPRPMDIRATPLTSASPLASGTGSGPDGLYIGKDFRAAYAPTVTAIGAGQTVGLFELDGFYASDVASNFKYAGQTPVNVQTVLLDGFSGAPGSGNIEVVLDIMMAAYMAPGASVIVYEGTNWNDVLNRMATDDIARQLSSSWSFSPINSTTENIFKQMIAQGQSLLQASGDSGAYSGAIMPPSDDPNLTVVGGTSLTTSGPGGSWVSETTWSGSGGGVSTTYTIPSYQQGVNMKAVGGSTTMRNIPDVALTADIQMFLVANNGYGYSIGGTSAAAPLWAGFIALANQQAAASGKSVAGFLNPALYALGESSGYSAALHDITTGSNGFAAAPGYDLATGWGTPAGQGLIDALTSSGSPAPSFALSASPTTVSLQTGASTSVTIQITAQSGFSGTVTLSASGLPSGVTATFGTTSSSGASTLTLTASSSAVASTGMVTVTGKSGTLSATVAIPLTVTPPGSFSFSASPTSVSLVRGATATSTVTVTLAKNFSGKVALAASGLPSGVTVSFNPASTSSTSVATFSATSAAALGPASVTLNGTAEGSAPDSTTLNLIVTAPPSFTLAAAPSSVTVERGSSATTALTLAPANGFSGSATLAISGLPSGVTAAFTPSTIASTSVLKLTASATATPGTVNASVKATSGSISASVPLTVTVPAPPGFQLSSSVSILSLAQGGTGAASIVITPQSGFSGAITFTTSGLPTGVTASFGSAGATGITLTLTATAAAAAKTSQFTITGTSGLITADLSMSVTVAPPPDFGMTLVLPSLALVQGGKGATAISVTPVSGTLGTVKLAASGLPSGVTVSFSPLNSTGLFLGTFSTSASATVAGSKVTVTATSGTYSHTATLSLTVLAPASGTSVVDLSPSYNVSGIAVDYLTFTTGGLDGGGRSYSGEQLGASQNVGGVVYGLGPMGVADAVSSQTVTLPAGKFATLKLLATGVNGNQAGQKFTVTYTDGTTSTFTQSLSDWCAPQNYTGETNAVPGVYRDFSVGTLDVRPLYLYGYSFSLNSGKTVKSVTLPQNRNVVVLAITLSSHS